MALMCKISIDRVSKSFDGGRTFAVRDASLHVEPGELVALLGESGSGKTTLLKMVNRLVEPDEGAVRMDGDDLRERDPAALRRSIGYVFQGVGLFPHMSVEKNVGIVPDLLGWDADRTSSRVDELLDLVGLDADVYRRRLPSQLSGGEKQRIGFARALAAKPSVLLLDEPFGALDPVTRDRLQGDFRAIQRDLQLTALLVTHDMTEALLLADRIAVMRQARILQVGSPGEILNRPADPYVRSLLTTPKRQARAVDDLIDAEPDGTGART